MRLTFMSWKDLALAHWSTSKGLIYGRAIRQRCPLQLRTCTCLMAQLRHSRCIMS